MTANIEETNARPPENYCSCWEIPGYFANDLDSFKKIPELAYGIIVLLGHYLSTSADYLKPIGATFKSVAGYIPATRFFFNIASWIPDQDGVIRAIKTKGNAVAKGISSVGFHLLDAVDTFLFLGKLQVIDMGKIVEKLGQHPVTKFFSQSNFTYLRSFLGFTGAAAAFVDTGYAVQNALNKMGKHKVTLDLLSGFTCQGWFRMEEDTPAARKAVEEGGKDFRDISTNFLKNALKTTVVALSIFGWALHPLVGFLSLGYTLVCIARVIIKEQDRKTEAYDPQFVSLWKMAKQLPTV